MGIPVSDQDRALQFYVETLGFDKLMDEPLGQFGGRWIEVSPPRSSTITIALTPAREEAPAGVDTGNPLHHRGRGGAAHPAVSQGR